MDRQSIFFPKLVQQKARSLSCEGEEWLYHLKDMIQDSGQRWHIHIEKTLEGGSEAFVAEVTTKNEDNIKISKLNITNSCEVALACRSHCKMLFLQ